MRELKSIKRIETPEEIHRSEKRQQRREKTIMQTRKKRQHKLECKEKKESEDAAVEKNLAEDRKKNTFAEKKPDGFKFLEAFSYINWTPFDKRDRLPQGFRSRSFNKERQYIDFFKSYIYPYSVSLPLLFTTIQKEYFLDEQGKNKKSSYYDIIILSKRWIRDIVSGDSFYRRNKEYFTKAEAHYFLNTAMPYTGPSSVVALYFHAKCKARNLDAKYCRIIVKMFTLKFEKYFDHAIVTGFLDLLARSPNCQIEDGELGDICDFLITNIRGTIKWGTKFPAFSFSGRTITSIISLANEWHVEIQRDQEALNMLTQARHLRQRQNRPIINDTFAKKWEGMDIPNYNFETDEYVWTLTQLLTAQDLLNEGRKMKNCVSSYTYDCSSGECFIFNLSCFNKYSRLTESNATLQVTRDRILVQAKAKCNFRIGPAAMNVIIRWAQANRIKNRVL
ncbi:PcfJ domain-containing protein [Treponema primitia]|uniref:PcfJ domain-containing protein n=1 Tax=Treponema primitia TaxID=88058 RepID=UPI0002555880|nr:PcfJ domain-containing protein [Treponema primitia]